MVGEDEGLKSRQQSVPTTFRHSHQRNANTIEIPDKHWNRLQLQHGIVIGLFYRAVALESRREEYNLDMDTVITRLTLQLKLCNEN